MIKIFTADQIKQIDANTIVDQEISSIDLMERASSAVSGMLMSRLNLYQTIYVFCGAGNNGGDGLAIARMLIHRNYDLRVFLVRSGHELSADCAINKERLEEIASICEIESENDIPLIPNDSIVIDCLFGVGLNRPITGIAKALVKRINLSKCKVYSVDMPSGLFVEDNTTNDSDAIVCADEVFTFQFPKLSLLLPDSASFYQKMILTDIDLNEKSIAETSSDYCFLEESEISELIKPRNAFAHKGTFGKAFIVSGMLGKMGAAIMSAKACLRTGVGLLTMHVPKCGLDVLQCAVPEAMVDCDENDKIVTKTDFDLTKYTIGIGPGIGVGEETVVFLEQILTNHKNPMVIDADALNIISQNTHLKKLIPPKSILTPHPLEFERLSGVTFNNAYERLQSARDFAKEYNVYIVLKGAYSAIVTPDKKVYFNSTGNAGMATGGSGDVLTGMITSLLAQRYTPFDAAILGVYLHGYAGDLAAQSKSEESLIPSDIIDHIGDAYLLLKK